MFDFTTTTTTIKYNRNRNRKKVNSCPAWKPSTSQLSWVGVTWMMAMIWSISLVRECRSQTSDDSNSTQSNGVCQSLSSSGGGTGLPGSQSILTIGLLHSGILVITSSLYVFSLDTSQIKGEIEQLYLPDKPVRLQQKWPTLYNDRRFKSIQNIIFNSFTVTDGSSEYVLFTVKKQDHPNLDGITYDIGQDKVYDGLTYDFKTYQVLLSTDIPLTFYALQKSSTLQIETLKFLQTPITDSNIGIKEQFRPFCQQPAQPDSIFIGKSPNDPNCHPVNWPVMKGFISSGKFYLFGPGHVFIFDQKVYTGSSHKVTKVRRALYSSFIDCGDGNSGNSFKSLGTDSNANSRVGIIIGVMLFVLLLVALIIFFMCRGSDRKQKDGHHEAGASHSSKPKASGGSSGSVNVQLSKSNKLNRSSTKARVGKHRSKHHHKGGGAAPVVVTPTKSTLKSSRTSMQKTASPMTHSGQTAPGASQLKTITIASRLKNPSQMILSSHAGSVSGSKKHASSKSKLSHNSKRHSTQQQPPAPPPATSQNNRISSLNYFSANSKQQPPPPPTQSQGQTANNNNTSQSKPHSKTSVLNNKRSMSKKGV